MASASLVQTKGLKRHFQIVDNDNAELSKDPISMAALYKAGKKFRAPRPEEEEESVDLNVVQFQEGKEESDLSSDESIDETPLEEASEQTEEEACPELVEIVEIPCLPEEKKDKVPLPVVDSGPAVYEKIDRNPEIEAKRLKLPVVAEEQSIMEAIRYNDVVIICGETGSGKTTQVPQFLYEAGYSRGRMIGVTEPRRVAAVSMSKRIGAELNLPKAVSYHIRFDNNISKNTAIKFMTDGVLLREVQGVGLTI